MCGCDDPLQLKETASTACPAAAGPIARIPMHAGGGADRHSMKSEPFAKWAHRTEKGLARASWCAEGGYYISWAVPNSHLHIFHELRYGFVGHLDEGCQYFKYSGGSMPQRPTEQRGSITDMSTRRKTEAGRGSRSKMWAESRGKAHTACGVPMHRAESMSKHALGSQSRTGREATSGGSLL